MKIQKCVLLTLLGFSLGMMSPVALAQNPVYEQVWWAQNPTLIQFTQNQKQPLKPTPVIAATSYPVQAAHTVPWRIENPTLHEASTVPVPTNNSQGRNTTTRAGSHGFRMYGENPTL